MSNAADLPKTEELLEVLRESVHEVFSSTVVSFKQAPLVYHSDQYAISGVDASGQTVNAAIDYEAEVGFNGALTGSVIIRCSAEGAMDIARGLLMLDASTTLAVNEVEDALGECANMVSGVLKRRALDPCGDFKLGLPEVRRAPRGDNRRGGLLVYQLSEGLVSMELWIEPASA